MLKGAFSWQLESVCTVLKVPGSRRRNDLLLTPLLVTPAVIATWHKLEGKRAARNGSAILPQDAMAQRCTSLANYLPTPVVSMVPNLTLNIQQLILIE